MNKNQRILVYRTTILLLLFTKGLLLGSDWAVSTLAMIGWLLVTYHVTDGNIILLKGPLLAGDALTQSY